MLGWLGLGLLGVGVCLLPASGCIARGAPIPDRQTADDGGVELVEAGTIATSNRETDPPDAAPHSVLVVDPAHGPFPGGQIALVRGTGFGGDVRVWFGDREAAPSEVVAVDDTRVQVEVPPGSAGPVDVRVQNGDDESTRASLPNGYVYDAYVLSPDRGPTSGGTEVTLTGDQTDWGEATEVFIDLVPCSDIEVRSETELGCVTPAGTAGSKAVRVRTDDGTDSDLLDGFTYVDSDNGYRGGLSGDTLDAELTVIALNDFTGSPIPGATVILGDDLATARETGPNGVVQYSGESLGPARSVTVAMTCFQPVTFVDVGVDTVTAYLDPVLSPRCAEAGDPPATGGVATSTATVEGELVWRSSEEFTRQGWTNVPAPASDGDARVAYVFEPADDPDDDFQLPSASSAITPEADGTVGFEFSQDGPPGNRTLYALAGLENRAADPPVFIAYAMGIARGARADPSQTVDEVFIPMNIPLDQALTLRVEGPTPTERGPDRVSLRLAISLTEAGYALLPVSFKSSLLPVNSDLTFVGLPPLTGPLVTSQYVITAAAVTSAAELVPRSALESLAHSSAAGVVDVSGFVQVPVLQNPTLHERWDGRHVSVTWAAGGQAPDVCVVKLQSGDALVTWRVAAPADACEFDLPDLARLDPELALIPGALDVVVSLAHVHDFDYRELRYRHLRSTGWNAYSTDTFTSRYQP